MTGRSLASCAVLTLALLAGDTLAAVDPLRPASSGGVATVERALARLDQHRRLMIVGAHPDDEDTTLLALVSLAQGGEAAYLSLTRGEGGQNLIGEELGEALGVLRTEELLAARRLDGARQLFTSAYDFGYTESLDETFRRWPREELLVEVVRAIRRFRPQVIVAVFPPDERAGHGQHQASAILAEEAFRVAGDAAAFPLLDAEGLPPWQPELLYREAWFDPAAATLELPSGLIDPLTGHTVFQLAMAGRSQHRSQSMGALQLIEGRPVRLTWVAGGPGEASVATPDAGGLTPGAPISGAAAPAPGAPPPATAGAPAPTGPPAGTPPPGSAAPAAAVPPTPNASTPAASAPVDAEAALFRGVDTRLNALAAPFAPTSYRDDFAAKLGRAEAFLAEARGLVAPATLARAVPLIADAHRELSCGIEDVMTWLYDEQPASFHAQAFLREKLAAADEALAAAAGLMLDATSDRADHTAGGEIAITLRLRNAGSFPANVTRIELNSPAGWWPPTYVGPQQNVWGFPQPRPLDPGQLLDHQVKLAIDPAAATTVPYFLRQPRLGDRYDFTAVQAELRGEPFEEPPLVARVEVELWDSGRRCDFTTGCAPECGLRIWLEREVVAIARDLAAGERREALRLVPGIEVTSAPQLMVWPLGDTAERELKVELVAHGAARSGRLEVQAPEGWPAVGAVPITLAAGERRSFTVPLAAPAEVAAGRYTFAVSAVEERPAAPAAVPERVADQVSPPLSDLEIAELPADTAVDVPTPEPSAPAEPATLEIRHAQAVPLVAYEHVRPRPVPMTAQTVIAAFPLVLPPLGRVGYVRGAADEVPESLRDVGVPVELLTAADLQARELRGYDAIVIGSRAYDAFPELAAANPRLLDYVHGGGLLLVQFQRWEYFQQGLPPVGMTMERRGAGRTTDETVPVRLLVPDHRVFASPNPIGEGDWEGWVQERGLYYPQSWDDALLPLLAMADPGEEELEGSLLVGRLGEGTYVYTGLAFFRQLPAGVPGAYRLFANLLALAEPQVESEDLPLDELESWAVPDEPGR
jgi:LmbE family N-acetylglucosaminyl deacetylase